MLLKRLSLAICLALALVTAIDTPAQGRPGRDRSEMNRDTSRRDREAPASAGPSVAEPYLAFERELPSLRVDLALTAEQLEPWGLLERDVRNLAELDRSRTRQLMALRDPSRPPPTAQGLMAMLADLDQRKADASQDLRLHLDALLARLDERQRKMLDRRVALSQSEPLGPGVK